MDDSSVVIELLGPHHERGTFSCGVPTLDTYLRQQASQDMRRRVGRVYVALGNGPTVIAGYYSLSAASFERNDLPPEQAKRLPHYPVPAGVIGRLAVDRTYQGRGLGELLLLHAVRQVVEAGKRMGVYAVIVDAKDESAKAFYERYGFVTFPGGSRRLFLPIDTFVKLNW